MLITNKAQYLLQDFDMAKGDFDMLYLCAGGRGGEAMIFSSHKSSSLEGGSEKKPWDDQGASKNWKEKIRKSS